MVPTFSAIRLPNSMLRVYPERRDYTEIRIKGLPLVVTGHRRSWHETGDNKWITYEAVMNGGKLVFEMGPAANKKWGVIQ